MNRLISPRAGAPTLPEMNSRLPARSLPEYRPDIDGLRGIAVFAVVWFHAFPKSFKGGFVGVDVFFVLSGYLISKIIIEQLALDRFSIADFYTRRIRRIFPALITVMLAVLAAGWFLLLADEYALLGKHVVAGAGFLSNLVLYSESGYFDRAAETKPLLHLWSLAIEEQFYIFWPLLLLWAARRKRGFVAVALLVAVASFSANIYLTQRNPSAAFYWPLTRVWELMFGGLLAYATPHLAGARWKNARAAAGIFLLCAGFFLIKKSGFPGWWALLPVAGTCLMISAGSEAWFNQRVLSSKVLVGLGLISYPLYLWHWPVLSFAKIIEGNVAAPTKMALVALSLVLAWLTYYFIEKPIRFGNCSGRKAARALLASMLLAAVAGGGVWAFRGLEGLGIRTPEKSAFSHYFSEPGNADSFFKLERIREKLREECNFGDNGNQPIAVDCHTRDPVFRRAVFLWGDSHVQHLNYGLKKNLPSDWQILQVASSGCRPRLGASFSAVDFCETSNWMAWKRISETIPDVVVIAQIRNHNIADMNAIAAELERIGVRKIIFAGPSPRWIDDLPRLVLRKLWENTPKRTRVGVDASALQKNQELKENFIQTASRQYLGVTDYFCDDSGCQVYLGEDRQKGLTSWDYGHLSPLASDAFARDVLAPAVSAGFE